MIKKISKEQALGLAVVCWVGLSYCLYSEVFYSVHVNLIAFWAEVVKSIDPLYMIKGTMNPEVPTDFANQIN